MTRSCPIPTEPQRRYGEIRAEVEAAMMRKVFAALDEAVETARSRIRQSDIDIPPPPKDAFVAILQQAMFCTLCKADPKTFEGGDARIALAVLRNGRNLARHYWGAETGGPP